MTRPLMTLVFMGWCGALAAAQTVAPPPKPEDYSRADVQYGAAVYASECEKCHGSAGDGVTGVNLRTGPLRAANTDVQLRNTIMFGLPKTGMPAFRSLDPAQLTGLVAYLRNMNGVDRGVIRIGDADRGRALFEGKGACTTCHRVNHHGGRLGPDLSDVGRKRTAASIERSVLDPSSQMLPINRPIRAVTRDGRTIEGRRLNEDTYTVQLSDAEGRLISVSKADLREYSIITTSNMPPYQDKLTPDELGDLIAYLLSLKG
jgi:putative heme-binding domain-containing protein